MMMKAIEVKFLGPTDRRGSRYKAYDSSGNSLTLSKEYELNQDENAERAAYALLKKMGWSGELIGGATSEGWAFVFSGSKIERTKSFSPIAF